MAQVIEDMTKNFNALSSNPSTTKTERIKSGMVLWGRNPLNPNSKILQEWQLYFLRTKTQQNKKSSQNFWLKEIKKWKKWLNRWLPDLSPTMQQLFHSQLWRRLSVKTLGSRWLKLGKSQYSPRLRSAIVGVTPVPRWPGQNQPHPFVGLAKIPFVLGPTIITRSQRTQKDTCPLVSLETNLQMRCQSDHGI
jgi:hypothetical protein